LFEWTDEKIVVDKSGKILYKGDTTHAFVDNVRFNKGSPQNADMRSTPWFHPKRSDSAPPVKREREPPNITMKEQEETTERLLRPTESVLNRQSLYWKLDGYMDRGFHSWSKMDLFADCKRCMWTGQGRLKNSCKIRPVNVTLPPLTGHVSGAVTSRSPPSNTLNATHTHTQRGRLTWRQDFPTSGPRSSRGQPVRSSLPEMRSFPSVTSLPVAPIARSATQYSIGV